MKNIVSLSLVLLLAAPACNPERKQILVDCEQSSPSNSLNTIMPLGASRVEGARPDYESYRYQLWRRLVNGGWDVDFIGTNCDEGAYLDYQGRRFDRQHEGRGGWTSGQLLEGIDEWLAQAGAPDMVLFSSPGGNDALEGMSFQAAVSNVNEIIDRIQDRNPEVVIIIEQMAPAQTEAMTPELTTWFNQMQQEVLNITTQHSDSNSKVVAVDMFTDFDDSLLADEVHYNEAGAEFVAQRYYDVMINYLKE